MEYNMYDKDLIKKEISYFGYNRYIQDVVCDYLIYNKLRLSYKDLNHLNSSDYSVSKKFVNSQFDSLNSKEVLKNKVIPHLIKSIDKFKK